MRIFTLELQWRGVGRGRAVAYPVESHGIAYMIGFNETIPFCIVNLRLTQTVDKPICMARKGSGNL